MRQPHSPPYHSPTQPPTVYRIPARRHPYQDHHDSFTSQFTLGGVTIQSPPRWSSPSPEFSTPVDPYSTPALSDCSNVHLPNDLEKSIQVQIDALERAKALIFIRKAQIQIDALEKAKALILARKNGSASNNQPPALPSPNPPYNVARNPSVIPITTEYPYPQGPMQPNHPGDPNSPESPDNPDCREDIAIGDYELEMAPLNFSKYELPEELLEEAYQRPQGPTRPISTQSSDGTIIYFEYPDALDPPDHRDDLNYPDSRENVTIKDYEPEILRLDFSRYELPEEIEELCQYSREPMQPVPTDPDAESRISSNVSDQLATPSEIFTRLQDDEEISATIAPVASMDDFFDNFSDDIFEYEIKPTQSPDETFSSPVETRPVMTWYKVVPEIQDTPTSPSALTSRFSVLPSFAVSPASPLYSLSSLSFLPVCHPDTSPPFSPAAPPNEPLPPAPNSPMSLPLPDVSLSHPHPSLPQFSDQMSRMQSFLWSFVTSASLFSKTSKPLMHSQLQPSESADSEKSSEDFELGIDIEDPTNAANCNDLAAVQSGLILTKVLNTSGDQSRVDSDKNTVLPSECNRLTEAVAPAECLSVLAEILADYEELDNAPAAPSPGRSPFLPVIALEIETFGPLPLNNSTDFGPPREIVATPSKESL